ncbi:MAG: ycgE 2 [Pseudomonas sp.]|nr:ycgE 2 [Pseudomonas sp.]
MTQSTDGPIAGADPKSLFEHQELFPIREVSRMTGINPVTLRAWERRYGLIQPTRTDSGHRLYSQADIEAVRSILGWIERGVAVSKVGKILARADISSSEPVRVENLAARGDWTQWQTQLRRAIAAFDERRLEQLYGQIFASYTLAVVFEDIFMPLWRELLVHQSEFGRTSEWLFLDSFLRARTLQRLQLASDASRERVLLAGLPEQCRELELWVAGLLMGSADIGIQVLALGQPIEELSLICDKVQPQALVLFSNYSPSPDLPRRLSRLALAIDCPLLLAGEASHLAEDQLNGSTIACLGSDGRSMQQLLQQFMAGRMDT